MEENKPKRIIVLEARADTEGHSGKQYYKIENGVKSGIAYKDITSEEKRALLKSMGIR